MNVVFDGQAFSFQEFGGISRYYSKLLEHFAETPGISAELLIKYSNNVHLNELHLVQTRPFFASFRFKGRNEIIKFLNRLYFKRVFSSKVDGQVFHPTYYHPYFLDLLGNTPFVLTIHDMAHERYPEMFSKFDHTSSNKRIVAHRANRIIAVSEYTKNEIVSLMGIESSRIDVVPHATTLTAPNVNHPRVPLPDEYILYVGKRNTYKNFPILLQTLHLLRVSGRKSSLICAGGGFFTKQELTEIGRLNLGEVVLQMSADDNLLAYLYSRAKAFVYPSLYEGFGIPILEAFACGCPAILSNRTSLPEIGGDAARYFDPENASDLSGILLEVLQNSELAQNMRTKGLERIKLFSWERTAKKTMETYQKVVG